MNNLSARILVAGILIAWITPATASTILVTENSQVTLSHGDRLLIEISAGDATPAEVRIVLGGMPFGGPASPIPGTSGVYMSSILFSGTLESPDGSISIPLSDANAARLGLPSGDLLMVPGSHSGGSYSGPVDLLSATATLISPDAAALFASGEAVIDLHNIGGSVTLGYAGSHIANDFSASLVNSGGTQSWGARVVRVEAMTATPEPGTINYLVIGLTMIGLSIISARASRRKSAHKPRHGVTPAARFASPPVTRPTSACTRH